MTDEERKHSSIYRVKLGNGTHVMKEKYWDAEHILFSCVETCCSYPVLISVNWRNYPEFLQDIEVVK